MTEITDTQREDERVMVMAVYISHHSIGVACHDERLNIIYVDSQYFVLDESEDILQHIKFSMMPTFLLLHPTMITNDALLQLLRKGYDESSDDIPYQVLKSSTWNESTCWNLIQTNLKIAQGPNAYQQLATCTDIENKTIIPAIGALISYLQTTSDHNIPNGIVRINKLLQIPLNEYLRIDLNSLQALQIFAEDVHPNMLKGTGKSKEGYSIFALMDRTKSLPGREKLRTWMSRPLANISSISERHRGVEFAINNSNSDLVSTLSSQMRHVHDIARLILRIKKVVAKAEDWCKVHTTLTAMIAIHVAISCFLRTSTQDVDFLNELMTGISVEALIEVNLSLSDWIDFDQTSKENVVTILHGRDPLLDRKRELYEDLEGYLVQAAQQILQDTPELHTLSVEYLPQVGYLVVLSPEDAQTLKNHQTKSTNSSVKETPAWLETSSPHGSHNSNLGEFAFVFSQSEKQYFKHPVCYELDRQFGDLQSDIQDRQRMIVVQLEEILLEKEPELIQTGTAIASLDAFMSLGVVASEFNLTRPQLTDEDIVVIKNGRHLLQSLTVDCFIPNDTLITPEKNISLITGANSSGKSIYLKQIGLIVYLAHVGSWVPCDKSVIGLTDQILTRIKSKESVAIPQSAFLLDLTQMTKMLKTRSHRSLCLIDEFGKGTNPVDGMSLLSAIIEDMAKTRSKCVFVLHFIEILLNDVIDPECMKSIQCFHMETIKDVNDKDPYATSIPLYKLKYGVEKYSEGIECARQMGVDKAVVNRAIATREAILNHVPLEPDSSIPRIKDSHRDLLRIFFQTDWSCASAQQVAQLRSLL